MSSNNGKDAVVTYSGKKEQKNFFLKKKLKKMNNQIKGCTFVAD